VGDLMTIQIEVKNYSEDEAIRKIQQWLIFFSPNGIDSVEHIKVSTDNKTFYLTYVGGLLYD
jgi:hypothetical protein